MFKKKHLKIGFIGFLLVRLFPILLDGTTQLNERLLAFGLDLAINGILLIGIYYFFVKFMNIVD